MGKLTAALLVLAGIAFIGLTSTVATLSVSTTTRTLALARENLQSDTATQVRPTGVARAGSNQTANGVACPGVEAAGSVPTLRSALVKNNWTYQAIIEETSAAAWSAGRIYRVELYGDGNLMAILYFQNATSAASTSEGVTMQVDLGSSTTLPDSYTLVVTQLASC